MEKPRFRFAIDRGGTFTDVYAEIPEEYSADLGGKTPTDLFTTHSGARYRSRVIKLLSEDPTNYRDAPTEGIRCILEEATGEPHPRGKRLCSARIESIRMGTTVATNALLERRGESMALVTTRGFCDLPHIGNQARPSIFDLRITRPSLLHRTVVEVDERARVLNSQNSTEEERKSTAPERTVPLFGRVRQLKGVTGEAVQVVQPLDEEGLTKKLKETHAQGIRSLAVALLHSYTFPEHEQRIGEIARRLGFTHVSLSSALMPMVKMVTRTLTASVDAYLTPAIQRYIHNFVEGFDEELLKHCSVSFMQSDGGLAAIDSFCGFRAILSGPAGGVVGYANTAFGRDLTSAFANSQWAMTAPSRAPPIIGFDMGGTSTDVSRYAGELEHTFETQTAGVTIQAPQLQIETVAAGGGSRLFFRSGLFVVGPESAGAHPGPVCYRKGGYLTITDANLLLGRLLPEHFPAIFGPEQNLPLDKDASRAAFVALTAEINAYFAAQGGQTPSTTPEEVAAGFLRVANETMCRPIRNLTQARGFDTSAHVLSVFGGAGGQHACAIARALGIEVIHIHRHAGILSAYGIALADAVHEEQEPCSCKLEAGCAPDLWQRMARLRVKSEAILRKEGHVMSRVHTLGYLNLRYQGTDTAIMTTLDSEEGEEKDQFGASGVEATKAGDTAKTLLERLREAFVSNYRREFGFTLSRPIVVDDLRVRAVGRSVTQLHEPSTKPGKPSTDHSRAWKTSVPLYVQGGWKSARLVPLDAFPCGARLAGPALLLASTYTVVVEPGCAVARLADGDLVLRVPREKKENEGKLDREVECDPIQLSIFSHRFMSIAEQMGRTLQRTSISTNIKERLDFSCALFGPNGGLVANAPHLPVHLGAMQEAVRFQIKHLGSNWCEGDVIVSNHPQGGGSHLPDITVMTPVFVPGSPRPVFYVASRGHHADIGGISPGSMPPFSQSLVQEGAAVLSLKLVKAGQFEEDAITKALTQPSAEGISGTRNLRDNLSDLKAQVAANEKGITLVGSLIEEYSLRVVQAYMRFIQQSAAAAVRDMLCDISVKHGLAEVDCLRAEDHMDDGTPIVLAVHINRKTQTAVFDFAGTGAEALGNTNAPRAITASAIIYSLRCLVDRDIPLNEGCLEPIQIKLPEQCLLSPSPTAAVVGGNVLTSQRITDVVLKAFQACAASQGCMNNLTFGDASFGYYETIAGGAGAGPSWHGQSGVHTHMTNTRITDVEILERRYPVLVKRFELRKGSGGTGLFNGGTGVVRDLQFLRPLTCGILSERRALQPYGLAGGRPGQRGLNLIVKADGLVVQGNVVLTSVAGRRVNIGGKATYEAEAGDRLVIHTPGGGGWGKRKEEGDEEEEKSAGEPPKKRQRVEDATVAS